MSGDGEKVKYIPARKKNYERYKSLPPFPSVIRGRFNPFEWMKDPKRRADFYDATMPVSNESDSETLKGFAGAAGRVEGIVRILNSPEEGDQLQPGEILVATTTNVGWTPLSQSCSRDHRRRRSLVPCRHRRPGTGYSGRCGMRQRHTQTPNRRPGDRRRWPRCRSYLVVIIPLLKGTGGCCFDRSASPCPLLNPLKARKPLQVTAIGLNRPQTGCRGLIPYNLYVCPSPALPFRFVYGGGRPEALGGALRSPPLPARSP